MVRMKKSQSISINTIIIAAIALAVLVVMFLVFTGRFKIFSEGVSSSALDCNKGCKSIGYTGGFKRTENVACLTSEIEVSGSFEGMKPGDKCCCSAPI